MKNFNVKNTHFKLINSSAKGMKEVCVTFDYKGKTYNYFIFIEDKGKIDYLKEAEKQFNKELQTGKVISNIQRTFIDSKRHWMTIGGILGAVTVVFASLFTWKYMTNSPTIISPDYHTITFMDGDKVASTIKVADGQLCPRPERITHGIFTSVNWTINPDIPDAFDFNTPIVRDMKLYANMRIELQRNVDQISGVYNGYANFFTLEQAKETIAYYPAKYPFRYCLDLSTMVPGEYYTGVKLGARGGTQPDFQFNTLWIGDEKLINGVDYIENGFEEITWIRKIGKANSIFYIDCLVNEFASGNMDFLKMIVETWESSWDPQELCCFLVSIAQ